MKYNVRITGSARAEVNLAFEYIAKRSPLNARRWLNAILKKIEMLSVFPNRCAVAPDSEYVFEELRHPIYKSHRVIFRVEEETHTVRVVALRHGAQLYLGEDPGQGVDSLDDE